MKIIELEKVTNNKIGRVTTNNVKLEPHEDATALFLTQFGLNIEYIKPSNIHNNRNADFMINGSVWETKSPNGNGNSTIARKFHKASKQADKMVLDLRRIKIATEEATNQAINSFQKSRGIRRLLLITKDARLIDIRK